MSRKTCFVIMPISSPESYDDEHFIRVYEDIFQPACEEAEYKPVRADEVKQTNLIQLDILEKLIESDMVLCDLSSTNPNVLFELGLRQAFDKPVTLVQEKGTNKIFDISGLRICDYRKERKYDEVLQDQKNIAEKLQKTQEAFDEGEGVNSIINLLSLSKAELKDTSEYKKDPNIALIKNEISDLKNHITDITNNGITSQDDGFNLLTELTSLKLQLNQLKKIFKTSTDDDFDINFMQNSLYEIKDKMYDLESRALNSKHSNILFNIRNEINTLQNELAKKR